MTITRSIRAKLEKANERGVSYILRRSCAQHLRIGYRPQIHIVAALMQPSGFKIGGRSFVTSFYNGHVEITPELVKGVQGRGRRHERPSGFHDFILAGQKSDHRFRCSFANSPPPSTLRGQNPICRSGIQQRARLLRDYH
ncbi:hypothetical protein LTR56_016411 [Elasticomyces elasticus]|nr:hypothetical protein LTR56_016411 [Elasticomyces elasticus]KAK4924624.1 hypothetical protein LTR49_008307 [Elasticomyces elasticus]